MVKDMILRFRDKDIALFEKIERVRLARGMTRKGFIMHAVANTYPELTETIVSWLINSGAKNRAVIEEELNEKAEAE